MANVHPVGTYDMRTVRDMAGNELEEDSWEIQDLEHNDLHGKSKCTLPVRTVFRTKCPQQV